MIVLLAGRPLDLTRTHGRAFFFDQGGRLARRFGLLATPSVVDAEGLLLRITEVPLEERETLKSEGEPSMKSPLFLSFQSFSSPSFSGPEMRRRNPARDVS